MARRLGSPGSDSPVTLQEVANLAGVHVGTASRALNAETRELVKDSTARKVLSAAKKLGYTPNSAARGLRTKRSYIVGVLVPDLVNPLFPPLVRGIEDVLASAGYVALVSNTDNDTDRERVLYDAMRGRQSDGFIFATALRDHPILDEAERDGIPTVLVQRVTDPVTLPAVVSDDRAGVADAVAHLVELGHRRIAHLAGPTTTSPGDIRMRGYYEALARHDLARDAALVRECHGFTEEAGREAMADLLDSGGDLTAVVAANDLIALGAIDQLRQRGLECPDDVSVVGFNDMPFADRFDPALTTVSVQYYELGAEGARMLLEQLQTSTAVRKTLTLPTRLVIRGSSAPVSVSDRRPTPAAG